MADLIRVRVTEVKSPKCFHAKFEKHSVTEEGLQFQIWLKDVNTLYNNKHLVTPDFVPTPGCICLGKLESDGLWYRVCVEFIFKEAGKEKVCCFLLDEGIKENIPVKWLREAREVDRQIPYQVKELRLYGLKAMKYELNPEDLSPVKVASDHWGSAATDLMKNYIEDSQGSYIKILFIDPGKVHHVNLYLQYDENILFFNKRLLKLDYAVSYNPEAELDDSEKNRELLNTQAALNRMFQSPDYSGSGDQAISSQYHHQSRTLDSPGNVPSLQISHKRSPESAIPDIKQLLSLSSFMPEATANASEHPKEEDSTVLEMKSSPSMSVSSDMSDKEVISEPARKLPGLMKAIPFAQMMKKRAASSVVVPVSTTSPPLIQTPTASTGLLAQRQPGSSVMVSVSSISTQPSAQAAATSVSLHPQSLCCNMEEKLHMRSNKEVSSSRIPPSDDIVQILELWEQAKKGGLSVEEFNNYLSDTNIEWEKHPKVTNTLSVSQSQKTHATSDSELSVQQRSLAQEQDDIVTRIGRGRGNSPQKFRNQGARPKTRFSQASLFKSSSSSQSQKNPEARETPEYNSSNSNNRTCYSDSTLSGKSSESNMLLQAHLSREDISLPRARLPKVAEMELKTPVSRNHLKEKQGAPHGHQHHQDLETNVDYITPYQGSDLFLSSQAQQCPNQGQPSESLQYKYQTQQSQYPRQVQQHSSEESLLHHQRQALDTTSLQNHHVRKLIVDLDEADDFLQNQQKIGQQPGQEVRGHQHLIQPLKSTGLAHGRQFDEKVVDSNTIAGDNRNMSSGENRSSGESVLLLRGGAKTSSPVSPLSSANEGSKARSPMKTLSANLKVLEKDQQKKRDTSCSESDESASPVKSILKKSTSSSSLSAEKPSVRFDEEQSPNDVDNGQKLIGEIIRKKLSEKLGVGKVESKQQTSLPVSGEGQINFDGVMVHSRVAIKPVKKISQAHLDPAIMKYFSGDMSPMFIQAYTWPAILRGNQVLGISPRNTGKTLAYLGPLLTQLLQSENYATLGRGRGPFAIILVPFWRKAQDLHFKTMEVLKEARPLKVLVTYGAGSEESQKIPLINGCDILITTPKCLTRLRDADCTNFHRLCHVVIDDADVVLAEFKEEVQKLMTEFLATGKKRQSCPHQVMVFGSQWNPIMDSFMQVFMQDPVLVLTSTYEAAVYGKVKQVPYLWKSDQVASQFIDVVTSLLQTQPIRILVFCAQPDTAVFVHSLLNNQSIYAQLLHEKLHIQEREHIISDWCLHAKSGNILVCTDQCYEEMNIRNASAVIHYELPTSRTRFGNRLACMSKYFWSPKQPQVKEGDVAVEPFSHIIITEKNDKTIGAIIELLKRTKSDIFKSLKSFLGGRLEAKEQDKTVELCLYMKAFGFCKYHTKCKYRHNIIPATDNYCALAPNMVAGEVRVAITHIVDASHYYCRILEHRHPDRSRVNMADTYEKLKNGLASWFSDPNKRLRYNAVCSGDLCALFKEDETFHRVRIGGIHSQGSSLKVKVFYVDEGKEETVLTSKLFTLPDDLKLVPFQAMELFTCRIKPVDEDEDWTNKASLCAFHLVDNKTLDGKIALRLGNTLWLDPLVERVYLTKVKTFTNTMFLRSELLKNGFAVENPRHLQLLYEACRDKVSIPDLNKQPPSMNKEEEVEILPDIKDFHDVFVSIVEDPGLFFVQRKETVKKLERLNDDLNVQMREYDPVMLKPSAIKEGALCMTQFEEDHMWYRVQILQVIEPGQLEVFFVDFGDKRMVAMDSVAELPEEFTDLPFQAIECELAEVMPRVVNANGEDSQWSEASGDLLWDLTHYVTGEKKLIVAKVMKVCTSLYSGFHKYCVQLFDTRTADDINLAIELVWTGVASPCEDSSIQEMFSKPRRDRFYSSEIQAIPDACSSIYWAQDPESSHLAAQKVFKIINKYAKSSPLILCECEVFRSIVSLIGRLSHKETHQCILDCIKTAAKTNEQLCQEIDEKDALIALTRCLEQTCRPFVQVQALSTFLFLLKCSESFVQHFMTVQVVQILSDLLSSSSNAQVQTGTCSVFIELFKLSTEVAWLALENKVTFGLQHCLEEGARCVVNLAAQALVILIKIYREHNSLLREKLVEAVISAIEKHPTTPCIYSGLRFCQMYSEHSGRQKMVLLEAGIIPLLDSLQHCEDLGQEVAIMCEGLRNSLVVPVPTQKWVECPPLIEVGDSTDREVVHPPVHWWQDTFSVRLAVKVKDADPNSLVATFSDRSIDFSVKTDQHIFEFNFDLYDEVVTTKCVCKIKSSEILVTLRKYTVGKWLRLLKDKSKPPFLFVDFERFRNSSSEDDDEDDDDNDQSTTDNELFVAKKRKKKRTFPVLERPKTGVQVSEGHEIQAEDMMEQLKPEGMEEDGEEDSFDSDGFEDHDPYAIFD